MAAMVDKFNFYSFKVYTNDSYNHHNDDVKGGENDEP